MRKFKESRFTVWLILLVGMILMLLYGGFLNCVLNKFNYPSTKKLVLFILICLFAGASLSYGQRSTETFETEIHKSTTFIDNGVLFNIVSNKGTFNIRGDNPGGGSNHGPQSDNRYIDNSDSAVPLASFSIKTTSNLFKVSRFLMSLPNGI